jgi:hypothetical protein
MLPWNRPEFIGSLSGTILEEHVQMVRSAKAFGEFLYEK